MQVPMGNRKWKSGASWIEFLDFLIPFVGKHPSEPNFYVISFLCHCYIIPDLPGKLPGIVLKVKTTCQL